MKKVLSIVGVIFLLSTCAMASTGKTIQNTDTTLQVSYEDAQRLMKIATAEAGNQGVQGMYMVMQVVWNRVQSENFPDSIKEVIEQKNAFSSVAGGMYQTAEPTYEAHLALAELEKNKSHDPKLIGFETVDNGESLLKYFDFYKIYKDHVFYQMKKD